MEAIRVWKIPTDNLESETTSPQTPPPKAKAKGIRKGVSLISFKNQKRVGRKDIPRKIHDRRILSRITNI